MIASKRARDRAAAHSGGAVSWLERRRLRLLAENALEDAAYDAREDLVTQETVSKAQRAVRILKRLSSPSRLRRPRGLSRHRPSHRWTPRALKERS